MTSEKQRAANRRNSKQSTGPRTQEGKALARFNATKHGLTALQPVLPQEDASQVTLLAQSLHSQLEPVGSIEELLVERIVLLSWRLQRMSKVEMGLFIQIFCEQVLDQEYDERHRREPSELNNSTNHRLLEKRRRNNTLTRVEEPDAKARIARAYEEQNSESALLGAAFRKEAQNADTFSKLMRYETSLEKSLYRALHELQRLQAARAGQPVVPPIAIDLNVTNG